MSGPSHNFAPSVLAAAVLLGASGASAQVTLLVSDDEAASDLTESGVDDGLRDALGGSVRRLEPVLEDLALAAGCAEDASDAACIARIANAGGAALVVIERGARVGTRWEIDLDLRRGSDGERLRMIHLACDTAEDCDRELVAALARRTSEPDEASSAGPEMSPTIAVTRAPVGPRAIEPRAVPPRVAEPPVAALVVTPPSDSSHDATEVTRSPAPATAAPRSGRVAPTIIFVTSTLIGAAAIGAGAVSGVLAQDALAEGVITEPAQAQRVASLEAQRDWALALGTGLAIVGACIAVLGLVTLVVDDDAGAPTVVAATDGTSGMIALEGRF